MNNLRKSTKWLIQSIMRYLQLYRFPILWNIQYKLGHWDKIGKTRRVKIIELVKKYSKNGKIVEFACGEGALIFKINNDHFKEYLGMDISSEAIKIAKNKCALLKYHNCEFIADDMVLWGGGSNISLIIMEECIYYISYDKQREVILKSFNSLLQGGVILITFHSKIEHKKTIHNCLSIGLPSIKIINDDTIYILLTKN